MAVYVDKLRDWGWKLGRSCHLISDAEPGDNEELHAFAKKLGLKKSWFQKDSLEPHYDLTVSKRALAVKLGAVELEDRPFHKILEQWRDRAVEMVDEAKTEREKNEVRRKLYS